MDGFEPGIYTAEHILALGDERFPGVWPTLSRAAYKASMSDQRNGADQLPAPSSRSPQVASGRRVTKFEYER